MNAIVGRAGQVSLDIRPMRAADVPAVMVSELAAYPHPWTEGIFRDCLRVGYYCVVGRRAGRLIAHAVMSTAVDESHILNLCVHPDWQGQGLGRVLLDHLVAAARSRGAAHLFLEVRASNDAAQQLYLSMGFNEIAQRAGYYPARGGRETALVFAKTLAD